jgi:hypothetical protein
MEIRHQSIATVEPAPPSLEPNPSRPLSIDCKESLRRQRVQASSRAGNTCNNVARVKHAKGRNRCQLPKLDRDG